MPLTVTGSRAYRDWNIRFRPRDRETGVKRTRIDGHIEVTFTKGGQTATLTLIGRDLGGANERRVRIGFGKGKRSPTATGVEIETRDTHVRIMIRDRSR